MTPIQASLKKNEGYFYHNLIVKRKKIKPKFQVNDFVRVADLQKTFSKRNTTNCSHKLFKFTQIINDTIPSYIALTIQKKDIMNRYWKRLI